MNQQPKLFHIYTNHYIDENNTGCWCLVLINLKGELISTFIGGDFNTDGHQMERAALKACAELCSSRPAMKFIVFSEDSVAVGCINADQHVSYRHWIHESESWGEYACQMAKGSLPLIRGKLVSPGTKHKVRSEPIAPPQKRQPTNPFTYRG